MIDLLICAGIPSALTGLLFWYIKRMIEKRDARIEERQKSIEKFMIVLMNESRATNILATATARAVQRIPDAKCNGDMTTALAAADAYQKEEKKFILEQGIKHIFEE